MCSLITSRCLDRLDNKPRNFKRHILKVNLKNGYVVIYLIDDFSQSKLTQGETAVLIKALAEIVRHIPTWESINDHLESERSNI